MYKNSKKNVTKNTCPGVGNLGKKSWPGGWEFGQNFWPWGTEKKLKGELKQRIEGCTFIIYC